MSENYEISIIIPCYNCEELIDETLESLVGQTLQNFEVICINDGSKDHTAQKLEEWERRNVFPMRVIHQENGGVSRARNHGISVATGKYILFLDADDCYHPEFVSCLYRAIETSGAELSYCLLSRDRQTVERVEIPHENFYVRQAQQEFMHNLLYRMGDIGFYCYLYRTEILKSNRLLFDVHTRYFEDREFNWKYLCHCQSAVMINAPLYWYRVNVNSVTQRKTIRWVTEDLDAIARVESYLQEMQCDFYPELKSYLFARVIWGKAKRYAVGGYKDLFRQLRTQYDVKTCMKRTARDNNKLVALASWLYLIHPMVFYCILRLKK